MRSLAVLLQAYPASLDVSRLLYFDYLVVHSGDVPNGPDSLHPATPYRSGELLVRRELVEQGLELLASRGLIERSFDAGGISYRAAEPAAAFYLSLDAPYFERLSESAAWVVNSFASYSDGSLAQFMQQNLGRWGAEFEWASVNREATEQ
jgi:hypothetical protein